MKKSMFKRISLAFLGAAFAITLLISGSTRVNAQETTADQVKKVEYSTITKHEITADGVKFYWTPVTGAMYYSIVYKSESGSVIQASEAVTDTCAYLYGGYGNPSEFYVRAYDATYRTVGTLAPTPYVFHVLDNPKVKSPFSTSKGLKISWDKVSGATSYRIYRSEKKDELALVDEVKGSKTSYVDGKVTNKKEYSYYVQAIGGTNGASINMNMTRSGSYTKTTVAKFKVKYCQSEARKQLKMINKFRTGKEAWAYNYKGKKDRASYKNLKKLKWDYVLEKACIQRAAEIAYYFEHTRPNGTSCGTASLEVGHDEYIGENIAYASYDMSSAGFMEMWKETRESYAGQGHRRNMLGNQYTGFACAICKVGGYTFAVQEFSMVNNFGKKFAANNKKKTAKMDVTDGNTKGYTIPNTEVTFSIPRPGTTMVNKTEYAGGNLTISWERANLAEGYYIYTCNKSDGKFTKKATVKKGETTTATLKNMKRKTVYIMVVPYRKDITSKKVVTPKKSKAYKCVI